MRSYLLAGGGTAGHVNPLLAVADGLTAREPAARVAVLGTREGLEARLVPARGYDLLTIPKVPFPRRLDAEALRFPARFARAVARTREHLRERAADVVIGFGGYAAAPAYVAAWREGIPVVVHEANARPGLANILGSWSAAATGVAFPGTRLRRAQLVGMPLRPEIAALDTVGMRPVAAAHYGLDPQRPTLLVFGGSLGAARLNDALAQVAPQLVASGYQIVHLTGERWRGPGIPVAGYVRRPYEERMDLAYALADLIVSRAGAATVSEISALGIPAIYVPYAVGNGEQALNAAGAVASGAARLVPDADLTAQRLLAEAVGLMGDPDGLERMRAAASALARRDGTERLLTLVDAAVMAAGRPRRPMRAPWARRKSDA